MLHDVKGQVHVNVSPGWVRFTSSFGNFIAEGVPWHVFLQTVHREMAGVSYKIAGQNDELISLRRFANEPLVGSVMGIELKKRLSMASVRQAQIEFLLFAQYSWFPFCQVGL